MPWVPLFEIHGNIVRNSSNTKVIPIGSEKWWLLGLTGPSNDEIYI